MQVAVATAGRRIERRFSVGTYLFVAFAACLAAVGTLVAVASVNAFGRERDRTSAALQSLAETGSGDYVTSVAAVVPDLLRGLVAAPGLATFDIEACQATLGGLAGGIEGARLHLFDPDRRQVCALDDPELGPRTETVGPWFDDAVAASDVVWVPASIDEASGHTAALAALGVPGADGRHGVLLIVIYGGGASLTLPPGTPEDTKVIVLDESRTMVLAYTANASVAEGPLDGTVDYSSVREHGLTPIRELDGSKWLYTDSVVPGLGWHVLAGRRESFVLAPAWGVLRQMVVVGLGSLLAIAVLGIAVRRRIATPVRALERVARRTAEGNDDERAAANGPREVARLGTRLNELLDERQAREADLRWQANHDVLTGLPNRAALAAKLIGLLGGRTEPNAVLFIDLDRFKLINDSHGHPVGDQLLVELGERLTHVVRDDAVLGRFGGDEFLLLCPGLDVAAARGIAQRLIDVISMPFHIGDQQLYVNACIGIASASHGDDPDEIVANADAAMFRAKAEGSGRIAEYDQSMRARTTARVALEHDLHAALGRGELTLHYQPVVDLTTGGVVRLEALLRWNHAEAGYIPPCDFIPIAEETGLIIPLGEWAIREAIRHAIGWTKRSGRTLPVAVNVAAAQINTGDFGPRVERILEEEGAEGSVLALEVTETSLLQDPELAIRTLRHLRQLGVQVSLDDFGTGYSSLSYLQLLPLDAIKIDRSFVSRLDREDTSQRIVRSVIELATAVGLQVVGEGIETAAQLGILGNLGCAMGQGFLLSHPRPASEIENIVDSGARLPLPAAQAQKGMPTRVLA